MKYVVKYGHSDEDVAGERVWDAENDADVKVQLIDFVKDGYRNGTWASTTLQTGEAFMLKNRHGVASARVVRY